MHAGSRSFRRVLVLLALAATVAGVRPSAIRAQSGDLSSDDFFSTDTLQDIQLVLNSRDWQQLKQHYSENTYYPADLRWRDMIVRNVGIRSRGNGSRNPFKPGLKVDINRYLPNQEFLGLKSFVLDNLAQDPSMLHERLSMRFFQRMGIPAPRVTHARLSINNEYAGLYGITESIDKDFLRRVFGPDAHGGVENDGYLFEYRYIEQEEPFLFSYLGPDLAPYARRFSPRTHENADPETLYRPIEQMFSAVEASSRFEFEGAMSRYLDLPTFMRQLAIENFLADWDGILGYAGANNFYLYRFEGTMLSRFIPWDKDFTFYSPLYSVMAGIPQNRLARAAMDLPAPYETYMRTLLEAADSAEAPAGEGNGDTPPASWLQREIAVAFEQIRDAGLADSSKSWSNDEFLKAVEGLIDFARIRSVFVRCEVYRSVDPGRVGPECRF
ncbi:MAG: CotH kinase family protein [Acidobacteria bacterium]|nr:CotH kinase family protein [Acidobacteriota bacterium]